MKAIVTTWGTHGTKIVATCERARVSMPRVAAESRAGDPGIEENVHAAVALYFCEKQGWEGRLAGGAIVSRAGKADNYVFVWVTDENTHEVRR